MRFLVFALIIALMVSMIVSTSSNWRHFKHGEKRHRRYRRYVPAENSADINTDLSQNEVLLPYYYPSDY
uniref:Statherin n=1 Tax=Rattus norvegicus TaxID=10116 RepID=A0A8I6AGK7_RAT